MKREEPDHAVANPGWIVAEPACRPGPAKYCFCDAVDPHGGKHRHTRQCRNDLAANSRTPTRRGDDREDREDENGERPYRFGGAGHEGEQPECEGSTTIVQRERAKSLTTEMRMHPGGVPARSISATETPTEMTHAIATPAIRSNV